MLLINATIVLPDRELENGALLIENERIARILTNAEAAELSAELSDEQTFDLGGAHLFAGFIDVHNHGAAGVDVNAASAADLQKVGAFLAAHGVTAWLPTLVPDSLENYERAIAAIDKLIAAQDASETIAARAVGVHYEGPFVNEKMCGALRTQFFKTFERGDEADELPRLEATNAVYLTTVAPEIAGGVELVEHLANQNWIVAIGHTRAAVETLDAAKTNGARHITHFFNAMTGLHHRDVGVVGWAMHNRDVTVDIIADGIHVAPPVLKLAHAVKTTEKTVLISDSVSPAGLGDGEFTVWNERIKVAGGKTENERGSIAGSVITMLDAVKMFLSLGVSALEVSQMASLNPARLLKIENNCGSIEIGKRADLTALDNQNNVILTVIGGRVLKSETRTK